MLFFSDFDVVTIDRIETQNAGQRASVNEMESDGMIAE